MVTVTFKTPSGAGRAVEARIGESVMLAAVAHQVEGIEAACGGSLVCGTCHGYIDKAWLGRLPPQSAIERDMLDYGMHVQDNSRLTCQIVVTQDLDGLVVTVPPSQR